MRDADRAKLEAAIVCAVLDQGDGFLSQRPQESAWCFANVEPGVFHSPTARSIYGAARGLAAQGRPWGAVSVWNALDENDGSGDSTLEALYELCDYDSPIPSWTIQDGISKLLRHHHRSELRQWHELGMESPVPELLDPPPQNGVRPFTKEPTPGQVLCDHWDAVYRKEGMVPTGLPPLDRLLDGGLHPGEMLVIGARTGVGKTALSCQIALNTLLAGKRFAYFSVEMSAGQILARLALSFGNDEVFFPRLQASTIRVYDDIVKAEAVAATAAKDGPFDLILVDHISIMRHPAAAKQGRVQEVSAITREIKLMAQTLKVPVIAACQLNRQIAGREDGRPRLSDLRDSGSVEQDADQVVLLYDPWKAWEALEPKKRSKTEEPPKKKLEAVLEKNRRGETGTAALCFERGHQRITAWGSEGAW